VVTRSVVAGAGVVVILLVAGCGSSGDGTVTGVAAPCVSLPVRSLPAIPVRISLQQNGRTVTSEVVHGYSTFRLSAPPGNYLLRSDAMSEAKPVTLTADRTVVVDLDPDCHSSFAPLS